MATALTLPDAAYKGETTHIPDHDLIVAACRALDERTTSIAAISGGISVTGIMRASTEVQGTGLRVGPNAGAPVYDFHSGNGNLNESGPFDLFWDAYNRKLHVRNVIVEDVGDPPDFVMRRGGISSTGYPDNPAAKGMIPDTVNCGTVYWCAMNNAGSYGGRLAQMYVRAKGDQTALNNGGDLIFGTMPQGSIGNPDDTFVIRGSGQVEVLRGTLVAVASTTARASFNIPLGVAPTSPVNGDIWYDGTHFYGRVNGVTKQLDNA